MPVGNSQEDEQLPGTLISFAPLVLPNILILLETFFRESGIADIWSGYWQGTVSRMFITIGHPVVAVGCGLLIAIIGLGSNFSREEVTHSMDNAIRSVGIILLLVGGGGALGMVLMDSGAANMIAGYIVKIGIPGVLLPLLLSTLIRLIQGARCRGDDYCGQHHRPDDWYTECRSGHCRIWMYDWIFYVLLL